MSNPVYADWVPSEGGARITGYQAVLSLEQAQERENTQTARSTDSVGGGFSSLTLTKPEAVEQPAVSFSQQERGQIVALFEELYSLSASRQSQYASYDSAVSSEPAAAHLEVHDITLRPGKDSTFSDSGMDSGELLVNDLNPLGEDKKNIAGEFVGYKFDPTDLTYSKGQKLDGLFGVESQEPYQKGFSLFDFETAYPSFIPEAVQETGVLIADADGVSRADLKTRAEDPKEMGVEPSKVTTASPKTRIIQWFLTLLDNFEMSLGPQEIQKQSSSDAASESALAAASGPLMTQGRIFSHPLMAAILGAAAELLRLSAEQLRDWLYEVEAFDRGSLRLKIRTLRNAVNYLLVSGDQKPGVSMVSEGYRVINAVDVDQELAALHILANPPRVHPFVRHVLFEAQAVPEKLKRYWLDVEKLKELYSKAGTEDGQGNVYFIRYKGRILKNAYRPMPDDMGGRYELVVAE